jgi:protein TonB
VSLNRSGAALVLAAHLGLAWLALLQPAPSVEARQSTALVVRLQAAAATAPTPQAVPRRVALPRAPLRVTPAAPTESPSAEPVPTAAVVAESEPPAAEAEVAMAEALLLARPEHAFSPPPLHPPTLLERGIGGVVWLRVRVERDGQAAEVLLLRGSGQRLLDESALDAVRRWRFVAARRGAQSLASWVEFPIRFSVRELDQRAVL